MTPAHARQLDIAEQLIREERPAEARQVLEAINRQNNSYPQVWWGLAFASQGMGDLDVAEAALRRVVALDRKKPWGAAALGDLLARIGLIEEAEKSWRNAMAIDRRCAAAAIPLAERLTHTGRAKEAVQLLNPILSVAQDPAILRQRALAYGALGRTEESLEDFRAAMVLANDDPMAAFDLAAALNDAGDKSGAELYAGQAIRSGFNVPEAWQVLSSALLFQDRNEEAEAALRSGLALKPDHPGLHRDLAQLRWMTTGDVGAALAEVDRVIAGGAADPALLLVKAKVLEFAGDARGAYDLLAPTAADSRAPNYLLCAVSALALPFDPAAAVALARRAVDRAPTDAFGLGTLAQAQLAAGRNTDAAATAARLRAVEPGGQRGIALQATAWRLAGDPAYAGLYDYDALVSAQTIATPARWPTLDAYLADLVQALERHHTLKAHPVGQSIRQGSQTHAVLEKSDDPVIRAFFAAADPLIRAHIDKLPKGQRGDYRVASSWSVRLAPGGLHVDHLHEGWLSSAFYVALPAAVDTGHQGWLRLGKPGVLTVPALDAERWIKPEPGLLVIFPSYMWHGAEAFEGDQPRLTIAFDLARA
jgi:tetratricopeptide (TPR) repeat protein